MKKINIAIVGCGAISYVTFPGYLKHPSSEIYALCDPLPERARAAAKSIGIDPIIYSNYDTRSGLFKDGNLFKLRRRVK